MDWLSWSTPGNGGGSFASSPSSSSSLHWQPPSPASCERCRAEEHALEHDALPCISFITCGRGPRALAYAKNWWRIAAFMMTIPCISLLATLAFMGMTLNGISFVPCRTIDVTAEMNMCHNGHDRYPCLQSYRIVEWSLYDTKTKITIVKTDRISEANCIWTGVPTIDCNYTSPYLLADALSWLNVNQTCWIDSESGSLRRSSTVAAADEERARGSPLPYGLGLGAALGVSICICGLWAHVSRLPSLYDERITDMRDHRHHYHTDGYMTLATFLMGFHTRCGGDSLRALRAHPHYDNNVTHLICQFADDDGIIPLHYDGHYDGTDDSRIDMSRSSMMSPSVSYDRSDADNDDDDNNDNNDGHDDGEASSQTVELLPLHHDRLSTTNLVAARLYSVDSG